LVAFLRISRQWNENHAMFWQVNSQDRWQNNFWEARREATAQIAFASTSSYSTIVQSSVPSVFSQFESWLAGIGRPQGAT
jgi:hypothetical protein